MTEMKKPVRLGSPEYQAVYDNILNYFNGDQLAADVLIGKYLKHDENYLYEFSAEELFNRLTDEFVRIEQKYPNPLSRSEIYDMFKDFKKSILGGSALSGIGNGGYVSFSNCYVIGNDSDSYGGIFKTDEEQTQLHKRRAGVGHDISHLRPANAPVQNSAITSSGGASFMERYSESTRSVAQNGRRGATILTCDISSMIAEDFIDAKTDLSKVTGCNVSIKVNNAFMHAVEHHEMFKQTWIHPTNPAFNMQKDVNASKLFDKIVHNNWLSAEPGLLFWDTVLKWSNQRHYGPEYVEKSVNPCFTGDTLLLTKDGYRTFEELAKEWNFDKQGYHVTLLNKDGEQCGGTVWSNGFKHVIKLVFNNKSYIECTPNHKFMLQDGTECEASSLIGKIVKGFDDNDAKCTQIIDDGNIKEVFDFNLNGDCHWGIVGGLIAHNCGELPLSPNQSCILLNLNLTSCVKNPFTKQAEFDFAQLDKNAYALAKLADDFIDLELEAVERIQAKIESDIEPESIKRTEKELWEKIHDKLIKLRKFGIGHMGIADVFAMLGIQYGTQQSIELGSKIQQTIANATYSASIDMAKDRGAFPIFDHDKDKNALFVQKMLEVLPTHYVDLYWKYGRRNVTTMTIPPTGCVEGSTTIVTNQGIMSMNDIFAYYNYDLDEFENLNIKDTWFVCDNNKPLYVPDLNGNFKQITKLYVNGVCDGYELTFDDNCIHKTSKQHKFLIKLDDNTAAWVSSDELKIGDEILQIQDIKSNCLYKSSNCVKWPEYLQQCLMTLGYSAGIKEYNRFLKSSKQSDLEIRYGKETAEILTKQYKSNLSKGHSLEGYIERYGEELGYEKYVETYTKSSGSLTQFIRRHGEEDGLRRYNEFRQKCAVKEHIKQDPNSGYNNRDFNTRLEFYLKRCSTYEDAKLALHIRQQTTTLNKYIQLYGEELGLSRYIEVSNKKGLDLDNWIRRYDGNVELAQIAYNNWLASLSKAFDKDTMIAKHGLEWYANYRIRLIKQFAKQSVVANLLFDETQHRLQDIQLYYANNEYGIYDVEQNKVFLLDLYCQATNKVVEFYGTYWHQDPRFYNTETDKAKCIHEYDANRIDAIKRVLGCEVLIIWEHDYNTQGIEMTVNQIIDFLLN